MQRMMEVNAGGQSALPKANRKLKDKKKCGG